MPWNPRTIRLIETIGYDAYETSVVIESVDLVGQDRSRSEVLHVSIGDIGKVHLLVSRVDGDVVQGVELSTEVVVEDDCPSASSSQHDDDELYRHWLAYRSCCKELLVPSRIWRVR